MNNINNDNADYDANNIISIAPMYYADASNGNGGNRNVLNLIDNNQVIEENHIGWNTR